MTQRRILASSSIASATLLFPIFAQRSHFLSILHHRLFFECTVAHSWTLGIASVCASRQGHLAQRQRPFLFPAALSVNKSRHPSAFASLPPHQHRCTPRWSAWYLQPGLVGFLSEPDPELRSFALKQLDGQVDLLWTEIANSVGEM